MLHPHFESDTIVAVATPAGRGAIGVVRMSGPGAVALASGVTELSGGQTLAAIPAQKTVQAVFRQDGTPLDHVLVTVFRAPRSYTGEDVVEISCHGGPAVLRGVVAQCVKSGARVAGPGEFSQRAFLNGKMDLAQAEAVADLIAADSERFRAAALEQLDGRLSREIKRVRNILVEVLAHIEVGLDHSDDPTAGPAFSGQESRARIQEALSGASRLVQSYAYGRSLREGMKVAIVGKPNTGKSSLLNALLKNDRAIVTKIPGTTRDTLEESFDLLGLPAVLVDTAGIRKKALDPVERLGIERSRKAAEKADAVVAVLDGSEPLSPEDEQVARLVGGKSAAIVAVNKSDRPQVAEARNIRRLFPKAELVAISALNGDGLEGLLKSLSALARAGAEPLAQDALVTSARHLDCLSRAQERLKQAEALAGQEGQEECLALEVREALDAFGEIVGEVATEDVLREIFSKFCIGK